MLGMGPLVGLCAEITIRFCVPNVEESAECRPVNGKEAQSSVLSWPRTGATLQSLTKEVSDISLEPASGIPVDASKRLPHGGSFGIPSVRPHQDELKGKLEL